MSALPIQGGHMTLRELKIGESAVVTQLGGEGALRQHFLDMGMIPGAEVTVQKMAPMGDPMELKIHGYELTLRLADARRSRLKKFLRKENIHFRKRNISSGNIRGLARAANIMKKAVSIRFRTARY